MEIGSPITCSSPVRSSPSACFGIFVEPKNIIIILMSIELILLAVNINLVAFSAFLHDLRARSSR
jgi:NADH:ubiquinone oxidoreductase subunit K